ncbi:MAG: peptide chain release factor N(5)-glutamine methyltransferase [Rhodoferax sp.]|uniref:peptide chain release factor N(5)-glutamine methyltransferase n=1 Tax=Rhodoferax sp. TaxID=50421 RepID=UPI00301B2345
MADSTLAQTLSRLQAQGLDRLDAQLLLLHVVNPAAPNRAWLLAHDTDVIGAEPLQRLNQLALRRLKGEPLAYLTGHKEFYGLDLHVDGRVLVPRPDTETLVDWALSLIPITPGENWRTGILDLGTGSGAIALALKATRPHLPVNALDFSEDALSVARANAQRLQLDVRFSQGSWLDGVQTKFALIVSNPPYIAAQDAHLADLSFEPLQALASGADGLSDLRQIIQQSPASLQPGGWLLLEHGYDQAPVVRALLEDAGFCQVQSRRDLSGIERCSGGCTPGPAPQ